MNYAQLLQSIVALHGRAQAGAASALNQFHVLRNWTIGAYVVEFEQRGEDRAAYGAQLLARLSRDLSARGLKGCSPDVLERMRQFYWEYPQFGSVISATLSRKLAQLPAPPRPRISATVSRKLGKAGPTPLRSETLLRPRASN